MNPSASVMFEWVDDKKTRSGSASLTSDGLDLDTLVDVLVAGLETSGYTVLSGEIVEQVSRVKRAPKPDKPRPLPESSAVNLPGLLGR